LTVPDGGVESPPLVLSGGTAGRSTERPHSSRPRDARDASAARASSVAARSVRHDLREGTDATAAARGGSLAWKLAARERALASTSHSGRAPSSARRGL
jgi:hypothetical protein